MNPFYHKQVYVPNGAIKLSPSSLWKFFEFPRVWYEENIEYPLDDTIISSKMITGTACHIVYEEVTKHIQSCLQYNSSDTSFDTERLFSQIDRYMDEYIGDNYHMLDTPLETMKSNYKATATVVVNEYISKVLPNNSEVSLQCEVDNYYNFYLAGTIDNVTQDRIIDYKTVFSKPSGDEIKFSHWLQLMAYRYMYQNVYKSPINEIAIVYGIVPMKTIGARCIQVRKQVTKEDEILFNDTIKLICESIKRCKQDNSLIPLVFKSMELNKYINNSELSKFNI